MLRNKHTTRPQKKVAHKKAAHKTIKRKVSSKSLAAEKAPFQLTPLPYDSAALEPAYTKELFFYHHGKHHQTYVTNLNNLVKDTQFADASLEKIIVESHASKQAPIFNNSAQHFNHAFFWNCMKVGGGGKPTGALAAQIDKDFGSFEEFRAKFKQNAVTHFGSGWGFLTASKDGKLHIEGHHDASTPFVNGTQPIVTVDVWEHSYYLGYKNDRAKFVDTFLDQLINWDFAEKNYAEATKSV